MRKLLVVLMVVAFAATAFAADVKLSGYMEVKGIYIENGEANEDSLGETSWWEQDGNIQAKFIVDKGTSFTVRGDFRDGTWGESNMVAKTNSGDEGGFTIQRAFLEHDFGKAAIQAGLMGTGGWGTAFSNNVEGNYRVKLIVPVSNGKVQFQTTKSNESGSFPSNKKDAEKDDNDQYGVDYVGKTGNYTYGFNLTYRMDSRVNNEGGLKGDDDSADTVKLELMLKGELGLLGFESEFAYQDVSTDEVGAEDYDLFGAYVNVWGNLGKFTPGIAFIYGSTDEDANKGYEFGDDFNTTLLVDLTDGYNLSGAGYSTNGDLAGYTAVKAYLDYAHNDALTIGGAFTYAVSNWDDPNYEDVKFYELDAYVSYQINKALNYTVQAGYAQADEIGTGAAQYDSDPIYLAAHTLSISF